MADGLFLCRRQTICLYVVQSLASTAPYGVLARVLMRSGRVQDNEKSIFDRQNRVH